MTDIHPVTRTLVRLTTRGFDLRRAPWEHKVCVLLHTAQGVIDSGGLERFFAEAFDGSPDLEDFPKVYDAVGAHESADALREALARSRTDHPAYEDLNGILWDESEHALELLARYIETHEQSFR